MSDDPAGDALRADAEAARDEIRSAGLICPSCGQNAGDLFGRHCLVLIMGEDTPWCECRDGAQVLLGQLPMSRVGAAEAWEQMRAAANIALMDDFWFRETIAFKRDVIGTGPGNFTGLLSVLERP